MAAKRQKGQMVIEGGLDPCARLAGVFRRAATHMASGVATTQLYTLDRSRTHVASALVIGVSPRSLLLV